MSGRRGCGFFLKRKMHFVCGTLHNLRLCMGMAGNIPRETHCGCGFKSLVGAGLLSIL